MDTGYDMAKSPPIELTSFDILFTAYQAWMVVAVSWSPILPEKEVFQKRSESHLLLVLASSMALGSR